MIWQRDWEREREREQEWVSELRQLERDIKQNEINDIEKQNSGDLSNDGVWQIEYDGTDMAGWRAGRQAKSIKCTRVGPVSTKLQLGNDLAIAAEAKDQHLIACDERRQKKGK